MGCSMVSSLDVSASRSLCLWNGRAADLCTAAKHIHGISRKARIWNVLKAVETETGYNTRATVKHLQDLVEQGN
jgi:hypothetical protein